MPKPPSAKSKGAPTDHDKSWLAHAQKEKQEAPKRLEETAKFLVAIVSISLTVFISNRPEGLETWTDTAFIGVAVIWMISVLLSFFVLFPWRYQFNPESAEDIERAYRKISNTKWLWLVLSLAFYLLGLGIALFAFINGFQG